VAAVSPSCALTTSKTGAGSAMWSAIYFLDVKGKILISRNYRGDVSRAAAIK
jgi:hypothetical protein